MQRYSKNIETKLVIKKISQINYNLTKMTRLTLKNIKANNKLSRSDLLILIYMLLVNNRFFFVQHLQSDIFQQTQCGIIHNFLQMRGENSNIGLIHIFNVFPDLTIHFILHSLQILLSFGIFAFRITKFVPNNQQNIHNHTNKKHNSQK